MLDHAFIQDYLNPEDIPFSTLPTMSEAVLQSMLPENQGKVYSANLHEGIFVTYFTYFVLITVLCIFPIFSIFLRTQ